MSAAAIQNLNEAADLVERIGKRFPQYNRKGRIYVVCEVMLGLSERQARRLANKEWKRVPSEIMDGLRELYEAECLRAEQAADLMEQEARERRARLERDNAAVLEPAPSIPGMGSELEVEVDRVDQGEEIDRQLND